MVKILKKSETDLWMELGSTGSAVDKALEQAGEFLLPWRASQSPNFQAVLRELLTNAVTHGNHHCRECSVHCHLSKTESGVVEVTVEDEGEGFVPPQGVAMANLDPAHGAHRGLSVVAILSEQVEFSEKGNRVTARIRLKDEALRAGESNALNAN